jgi:P-type Ca2+ transporter type 2C
MRQPPRRKGEPIITRRLLQRVLFSASIIVFGTAFVYAHALGDDTLSRRDQTLVSDDLSFPFIVLSPLSFFPFCRLSLLGSRFF